MVALQEEFDKATEGRNIWLLLKEKYEIKNSDGLFFFVSNDYELCNAALELLPIYKKNFKLEKIIALTGDDTIYKMLNKNEDICSVQMTEEKILKMLYYYRVVNFFKNIVIVSLDEPYGNDFLIKNLNVDLNNFVKLSIYKMR